MIKDYKFYDDAIIFIELSSSRVMFHFYSFVIYLEKVTWQFSGQWTRIDHLDLESEGLHDLYCNQILQLERVESMLVLNFLYAVCAVVFESCIYIGTGCLDVMSAAKDWHLWPLLLIWVNSNPSMDK